jgi:hypothetical protein
VLARVYLRIHKSSEVRPEGTVGPAQRVTVQMLLNTFPPPLRFCREMMLEIEGLGLGLGLGGGITPRPDRTCLL